MATVEKRGDGWRVRWRDPDGQARSRQCPSARVARELHREVEDAIARGQRWAPAAATRYPLLRDLIAAYLRDLNRTHRPRTVLRAHASLGSFLAWASGRLKQADVTVDAVTRALVAEYDTSLVERGLGVSSRRTTPGRSARAGGGAGRTLTGGRRSPSRRCRGCPASCSRRWSPRRGRSWMR